MFRQLLVAGVISLVNITIHALVMTIVVRVAQAGRVRRRSHPFLFLMAVMIPTVSILMITHIIEVFIWAGGYWLVEAAPPEPGLVYFAFVNFATLGYGDVVPVKRWLLLGPMTAMNGWLLFGWSTAVIFEVLRKALALSGSISDDQNAARVSHSPAPTR